MVNSISKSIFMKIVKDIYNSFFTFIVKMFNIYFILNILTFRLFRYYINFYLYNFINIETKIYLCCCNDDGYGWI